MSEEKKEEKSFLRELDEQMAKMTLFVPFYWFLRWIQSLPEPKKGKEA